jgi:hypothetical protein
VKISLRKKEDQPSKLRRRLLPFYMKPAVLVAFMILSLVGQVAATTAIAMMGTMDTRWCAVGFAVGIIVGYVHGKWTSRMWTRDYLRVLKREISFWQASGATGTTVYVMLALGIPVFLAVYMEKPHGIFAGLQPYIFGFIGGMNLALYLWVRRLPR